MKFWIAFALFISSAATAETASYRKSILQHGVQASAYGELGFQQDTVIDAEWISGRVQGGWLLSGNRYVSSTIGASYTGLGAKQQKDSQGLVTEFGYYGPIVELIFFPEAMVKAQLSYGHESGFLRQRTKSGAKDFAYTTLKVRELRGTLAFSIGRYQQIILGLADQDIQSQQFYKFAGDGGVYRRRGQRDESSRSYFLGFRLAAY